MSYRNSLNVNPVDLSWLNRVDFGMYYRWSAKGGRVTESTRAPDNHPMSSRSQALFRSITEVEHVLRQHGLQFNQ
jgi:hypothetical protein